MQHLASPRILLLLAFLPALSVLALVARMRRRRRLASLGSPFALRALSSVSKWRRAFQSVCASLGVGLAIFACAGPRWGINPEPILAIGRDLVVVLDLSHSMLAEDAYPSRLGWAVQAARELSVPIERQGGHRLALVTFAGRACVDCPLTPDYDHFRDALNSLDAWDAKLAPRTVGEQPASGTRIGLALQYAVQLHDARFHGHQEIILLTDGDDPAHDEEWRIGVTAARVQGIPVSVIGIGNPHADSTIPDRNGKTLTFQGTPVHTRLDESTLKMIAQQTGGDYRLAWQQSLAIGDWLRDWLQKQPGREISDESLPVLELRYGWFFGAAVGCLALACVFPERARLPCDIAKSRSQFRALRPRTWWLFIALLLVIGATPADDAWRAVHAGNDAFERGDYAQALNAYSKAEERITDPGLTALNTAAALYRLGRYRDAEIHYWRCLEDAAGLRRARLLYDLGNCLVRQSQGRDSALLDRAVRAYEDCLREPLATESLQDDARHNRELAAQLRQKSKLRDKDPQTPTTQEQDQAAQHQSPTAPTRADARREQQNPNGKNARAPMSESGNEAEGASNERRVPGTGNLPPIPDSDELTTLPPEDARAHLRKATARILDDRKKHQQNANRPTRNVLDW